MIRSFKAKKDSFEYGILLFKELERVAEFNVLFGGNGVGKTTLIDAIKQGNLEVEFNRDTEVLSYINSDDNIRNIDRKLDHFYSSKKTIEPSMEDIASKLHANTLSEGQSIIYSLIRFLGFAEGKLKESKKDLVLLFDEVDSGLSSENINMFVHLLLDLIDRYKGRIQVFVSSNNYHFVFIFKTVLNMYTGKYEKINSYEEYYKLLAENMVKLGKKRGLNFL